jgi:hypothetical protein
MKNAISITTALLLLALRVFGQGDTNLPPVRPCMTNLVMTTTAGNVMKPTYGTNQEVTALSGIAYLSCSCDVNDQCTCPITFTSFNGCSPKATTVAWVTWTCDSSAMCPGGPHGEPTACGGGGSLAITMPANCTQISYILTNYGDGCCSLRLCEVPDSRTICIPPAPAPGNCSIAFPVNWVAAR